ncbi:hypothetical protein BKA69DRAFT_874250 [Paraphysoderma sedebokerense]|nr:hypothetical protein BKA69DRAFT_874250 [Paraphysoderma sedebokerense]
MIPNPKSLTSAESGGSSSNGSNQSGSNGEFPGLGLAGHQLHQASSSNENSGESSNGNGHHADQVGAAHHEKIANPKREEERLAAVNVMDNWRDSDGEWDPDCDPDRFAEVKIAADEYYADDGFSMPDDRLMKGRIGAQFDYLAQPPVRHHPSRHHRHSSRTPRQHYHSHSHSHSHSHHHYGYPPQDQRNSEEAMNRLSASASNSSQTEGSNQSEQMYSQNYYQPLPSPSATAQSMAARNRMSSGTPAMRSPINQNFVESSRSENPQTNVNELGHQGYPGRRPSYAHPNANAAEDDNANMYPPNPGYRNRSDSHSTVEFNMQSSNSGSSSNNRQPHIPEIPSQTSSLSSQQFRLNARLQHGYDSNNNVDPGSSASQRRGRRNQSSSSTSGNNVNSNTGDFKIPMMVTGVLAYTPRERFLLERNDFLEGKVRELEHHMVEIRTALDRQRWLDQRVGDLEVEKRVLKQLLFEQNNRNVAEDQSSLSGSAGGKSKPPR